LGDKMRFTLDHPAIGAALDDLRRLLAPYASHIDGVELFGSTLQVPVSEARDIDFFVAFRGLPFQRLRAALLGNNIGRHVVVESLEASYSNCPSWELHTPLTMHLILYRRGASVFSEKLARTKEAAVDVTPLVLPGPESLEH
jgi:hypothetical protein